MNAITKSSMEPEVKVGIDRFREACEQILAGIQLVIPQRPTGGAFLVSLSHEGFRTYSTIKEDDFADWGEEEAHPVMLKTARDLIRKLLQGKEGHA